MLTSVLVLDPALVDLTAVARDLCEGDGNTEYVRACADLIIGATTLPQDARNDLIAFLGAPAQDPNGPLTSEQRRALFAAFEEVFGTREQGPRLSFTSLVLGTSPAVTRSWSEYKPGRLTYGEASKLLDWLDVMNQ